MTENKQPRKHLNDLTGKEWVKATKSWFVVNPRPRTKSQVHHPAKFPEELVKRFVEFFTCSDTWVLDPFAGVGSAMIACIEMKRNSVGIDLNKDFIDIGLSVLEEIDSTNQTHLIEGDSLEIGKVLEQNFAGEIPEFRYLITSPPYWNMLRKSRGGSTSIHKERKEKGFKQFYSDSEKDIGNIEKYQNYIESVTVILEECYPFLAKKAYLTVVVQNMRDVDGTLRPIAWDLARSLSRTYSLQQEMIWCQDNKRLGIWGYPTTYISNVHHHYCLIFKKL
ncbi:MAG: DNA methyltransferase [Candidatus Thorarchaeota archaeon]